MMTVTQISKTSGVSVRTLRYYDAIGLLKPTRLTDAGYRLYDSAALERLHLILLFREIGFPLKEICGILDAPDFERNLVLDQQIELLQKKIDRLKNRIALARGIKLIGIRYLEMEDFHVNQIDTYSAQAKTLYGKTDAYKEYQQKSKHRTQE